ncbi:MAG TPA: hypothetical protein VD837_07220 [Terriglobales bacterium]|nr:hypothetical protein [Terriglobales bacterium]
MLGRQRRILLLVTLLCVYLAPSAAAQQTTKVTLDTSETIFSVMTAINACGYDQELSVSDPVRAQIRAEVAKQIEDSPEAGAAARQLCRFYREHQQSDSGRELAQYLSLALNLGEPPAFVPKVKDADLPPDAFNVLGVVPALQRFYTATNLHGIWLRHQKDYDALISRNHEAVAKMLLATDVYLKIPITGYVGREFVVYVEPMAAPAQTNARNYGADYFMVISPDHGQLNIEQIRHTYLHFSLDPLAMKRPSSLRRLAPILEAIKTAPLDENYKTDASLLVTESLIRAIEARLEPGKGKDADLRREQKANEAAKEGFVLAPYFYEKLVAFEKDPAGLKDVYADWLYYIDIDKEKKRASNTEFKNSAAPEVVRASRPKAELLEQAEIRFSAGDLVQAKELAQKALDTQQGDSGRALFLLAQIATVSKDMQGAQGYFEKTLEAASEPRLQAWSHIYLGRIFDLKAERETALKHYRAALDAGDPTPATKAAAERGLKQPYEPPVSRQQTETNEEN